MEETKPTKTVYLSGPISGYDLEERRKVFSDYQQKFEDLGYKVMNPMANGLPADSTTHQHMRRDFEMLIQCDTAFFMEKWLHSSGCKTEFEVATACGMEILFEVIEGRNFKGSMLVRFK